MTEAYEDGNYLVRVRAQVMTRDDSSGGWVPLGGGGLSNVSVRKRVTTSSVSASAPNHQNTCLVTGNGGERGGGVHPPSINGGDQRVPAQRNGAERPPPPPPPPSSITKAAAADDGSRHSSAGDAADIPSVGAGQPAITKHEYFIYGKRISDQSIVLSCTIKKDFEYNKVMPTFHHWRTEDKKFGLTFQTAADARAFDKGVRNAVEDLLDGLAGTYPLSPLYKYSKEKDVGDDDVFMTLNLPVEPPVTETRSSSEGSASISRISATQHGRIVTLSGGSVPVVSSEQMQRLHYPHREFAPPSSKDSKGDNYSYVQLTDVHEYIYPVVEESKASAQQDSSLKKRSLEVIPQQPTVPSKSKHKNAQKLLRSRCRYCNDYFSEDDNARGSCVYAPDCVKNGIDRISCIDCAQCMLYHCMADAEGDFPLHPCMCNTSDENCGRRWAGVALLSLLVPCLWFYPPLRACHSCCVNCGLCGGRHSSY